MTKKTLARLLLCALVASALGSQQASAKDMFALPAGISPTSTTLSEVLAAARKADGFDKNYTTRLEIARVTAWGLKGSYHAVESAGNFKSSTNLGALSWQQGRLNGQLWHQNENGLVILLHDWSRSADTADGVASYRNIHESDARLLGETAGSDAAYVVEVHPQGQRLKWLFFDKKSYLVTRVETPFTRVRYAYTYSDFRKTGPYVEPWHAHASDGITQNDMDYVTTSLKYGAAVTADDTSMPQSNDKLLAFPAGKNVVDVPAKLINKAGKTHIITSENEAHDITRPGSMSSTQVIQTQMDPKIVVQLTINGQAYNFYLDSGAGGIYIDSDLAEKLGLKTFGPSQQTKFGKWVQSYALVPDIHAGDLSMTNVIANVLPSWHDDSNVGSLVEGLVGYDFIANAVLKIDYEKGVVTATVPFMFVPPADAIAIPASFDDGVPAIPVQIGQSSSDHFILDTGSPNCFIFKSFAQAHADDVKDQGSGVTMNHVWVPMYGFSGFGGDLQVRATEVKSLTVTGVTFNEWIMFMNLADQAPGDNYDGLIGYDFLKYFTVYLAYAQNQIFLQPNALARSKAGN